jgi:hypothetical protein
MSSEAATVDYDVCTASVIYVGFNRKKARREELMFQVLMASNIRMTFWYVALRISYKLTDVSEELTATIIT